jgi:phosphoribosylformylglycinamidine synthase
MPRIVVDVMLKPEILDPQGRAVQGALSRLGLTGVTSVRQGKRFEIEIAGELDEALEAQLEDLAGSLLSNPVIEDWSMYSESEGGCDCGDCACGEQDPADAPQGTIPPVAAEAAAGQEPATGPQPDLIDPQGDGSQPVADRPDAGDVAQPAARGCECSAGCKCGPACDCGPECRCGAQCDCGPDCKCGPECGCGKERADGGAS